MRFEFKTASIFLVVILWGTLLGGIVYEHLVFMPVYLSALPDSSIVVNGTYGLRNQNFWQMIHPFLIVSLASATALNWRSQARRKLLAASVVIYALVLTATFLYFVPELIEFQESPNLIDMTPAEWLRRGELWQRLSYIRGAAMYAAFVPLLVALTKSDNSANSSDEPRFRNVFGDN